MDKQPLAGEYFLQGVREMASGFLLEPDGKFRFFFSYGALDRYGSGIWTTDNDKVIFKSAPKPQYDFACIESRKEADEFIMIRLKENNQGLARFVYGSLQKGVAGSWVPASQEGEIMFPKQEIETISLTFEFSPERISVFEIKDKSHNDFSFRFESWLFEVFLDGFTLRTGQDELTGGHPVLDGVGFRYVKQ